MATPLLCCGPGWQMVALAGIRVWIDGWMDGGGDGMAQCGIGIVRESEH